jgi:FPC/CPF motif-containing protein YcgG
MLILATGGTLLVVVISNILLPYLQSLWSSSSLKNLKQVRHQAREARKSIELTYDPQNCPSFHRFQLLAKKSNCIFAKNAQLWGCLDFDETQTLSTNVQNMVPALMKFVTLADEGMKLDGFLIEIKGKDYCSDVTSFASTVKQTLEIISANDPSGLNVMKLKGISSSSWYYSFCTVPLFVTTFAPFYSQSHCRYMHSLSELGNVCYLLLQPEISFYHHKIGSDTPHTNWESPQTIRDQIRLNFRKNQRGYFIPPTNRYAIAEMIVIHPQSTHEKNIPIKLWDESTFINAEIRS